MAKQFSVYALGCFFHTCLPCMRGGHFYCPHLRHGCGKAGKENQLWQKLCIRKSPPLPPEQQITHTLPPVPLPYLQRAVPHPRKAGCPHPAVGLILPSTLKILQRTIIKLIVDISTLACKLALLFQGSAIPPPRLSTPTTFPGTLPRAKERRTVAFLTALRAAALFECPRRCTRLHLL